jgi:putative oxidoreductase
MSSRHAPSWNALVVLRGVVALAFMAHALVRLVNGSVPQFGAFLERCGLPQGVALVYAISAVELVGGSLLVLGLCVRTACVALGAIVVGGVALIHVHNGWFVGEHGVGGMEYSALLVAALFVLAAADDPRTLHTLPERADAMTPPQG